LKQYGIIPAQSALMFKFTVNNPSAALQSGKETNEWRLTLHSKGSFIEKLTNPAVVFKSTTSADYSSNLAVMGYLSESVLFPADYMGAYMSNRIVKPILYVFFKTEQSAGLGSKIVVVPPVNAANTCSTSATTCTGYAFDAPFCDANVLPDSYYAVRSKSELTYRPPQGIKSCQTKSTPYESAEITVNGLLDSNRKYGFSIRVTAPYVFDPSQLTGWKIYTQTANGDYVDGTFDGVFDPSQGTVPFTEGLGNTPIAGLTGLSYGLYQYDLNTKEEERCGISINNMFPGAVAEFSFFIKNLPNSITNKRLRIVAPFGYEWQPASTYGWRQTSIGNAAEVYKPPTGKGTATADFPQAGPTLPTANPKHVLTFAAQTYTFTAGNEHYGFTTNIKIPNYSPRGSSGNFTIEFGYDLTGASTTVADRPYAGVIPAPQIRALTNANVGFSTNVENKLNQMRIELETVTQLPANGGIVIVAPANFVFASNCGFSKRDPLPAGYHHLPDDAICTVFSARRGLLSETIKGSNIMKRQLSTRPELRIKSPSQSIDPKKYSFNIAATNPVNAVGVSADGASSCGSTSCWDFSTHPVIGSTSLASATGSDLGIGISGFQVNVKMLEARFEQIYSTSPIGDDELRKRTNRDDRPSRRNSLIFAFKMACAHNSNTGNCNRNALLASDLVLRAPEGYVFDEDCLSGVDVRESGVFGGAWNDDYLAFALVSYFQKQRNLRRLRSCLNACFPK